MGTERSSGVLIVADDLTSAADGAAPFASRGSRATIQLRDHGPVTVDDAHVRSIDADTRRASEAEAKRRIASILAQPLPDVVVKTIDSTVRGHVAAELAAARQASGRPLVILAPAFPAEGRTTRDGVQLVDGVPVAESSFATARNDAVARSDLREIVPGARLLGDEDPNVASGVVVVDASHDHDLDALVARVDDPRRVLWVGSPGLCAALARSQRGTAAPVALPRARTVAVIVGSEHSASRAQLAELQGLATPVDLAAQPPRATADTLRAALADSGIASLTDTSTTLSPAHVRDRIASTLAAAATPTTPDALVLTGGDTARATLDALDVAELHVLDELEPGIVATRTADDAPRTIVLKAGGFGDPALLRRLVDALHTPTAEEAS